MKSARRRSREFALQALYQWQLTGHSLAAIETQYAAADGFAKADSVLFDLILSGVLKNAESLKLQLAPLLDRPWKEISPVEAGVLLIGTFELQYMPETPYRVIINEAIELAKSFGGTDGHKYINGILDKFAPTIRAREVADYTDTAEPRPVVVKPPVKVFTKTRRVFKPAS
jgi:transcription antitermination protein NusB